MDINQLEKWIKDIQVQNMINADVEVVNKSPMTMIGKGRQGAVFQFSDDTCVKVFGNTEDCDREYYALSLGQKTNLLPKVYAKGSLYIAMEIVTGVDLREYLQSQVLTIELSQKLIEMLIVFKEIGFERIDHHKRQIYLQPDGNLKVIDVARTVWRDRVYPYPRKLLTSLGEENKDLFLSHVQAVAPDLYKEWIHYIEMEMLSRGIYQKLLTQKLDEKALKNLSKKLLTTKEQENYVVQLEGLVNKVFKEEWVKVMIAKGYNPEKVMEKIDKYWDEREQKGDYSRDGRRDEGRDNDRERSREKDRRDEGRDKDRERSREKDRRDEGRDNGRERSREKDRRGKGRDNDRERSRDKDRRRGKR